MPLPITFGAASSRGFGLFNTSLGDGHWLGFIQISAANLSISSLCVDSDDNILVVAQRSATPVDGLLLKLDRNGNLLWQKNLVHTNRIQYRGVTTDSLNNIYCTGDCAVFSGTTEDIVLVKYDPSGNVLWQRAYYDSAGTGYEERGASVLVHSNNDIYIAGQLASPSGTNQIGILKFSSSPSLAWAQELNTATQSWFTAGAIDSAGDVYVCSYRSGAASGFLAKYNSSGSIQFHSVTSNLLPTELQVTSSGSNIYVSGNLSSQFTVMDCTGPTSVAWSRTLSGARSADSICLDQPGGFLYVSGWSPAASPFDAQIAKYNTSGTIQWQRTIASTGSDTGVVIKLSNSRSSFVVGITTSVSGVNAVLLAKLPVDGSKTGTYSVGGYSFTYSASSLTDTAGSASLVTSGSTTNSQSGTLTTTSFTEANASTSYSRAPL